MDPMMFPRRRFSVFQRDQKVTVGPLGFDVPITTDPSAFPSDDAVDEADRLSDVDYPDPGHERHAKRQRIEDNARDYLCGKPLDLFTASLRGPFKNYHWGKKATVTGTILELKAAELKGSILTAKREARRQLELRGRQIAPSQEQQQTKITSSLKVTKAVQTPVEKPEELLLVLDSQQAIELSQSQGLVSSPPKKALVPDTPLADKQPPARRASIKNGFQIAVAPVKAAEAVVNPARSLDGDTVPETSPGSRTNRGARKSKQPADDPALGQTEAVDMSTDDIIVPATSQQDPLPIREDLRASPNKGKSKPDIKQAAQKVQDKPVEEPRPAPKSQVERGTDAPFIRAVSADTVNFDLDKIDRIARRLSADDTVNFFQNEAESRPSRDQSPSTALRESLPKMERRPSAMSPAPPSPTAEAILRKAQKAPATKRRNNLGSGTSLKDIITRTSRTLQPVRRPRRSQTNEYPDTHDNASKAEVSTAPAPEMQSAAPAVKAFEPLTEQDPMNENRQPVDEPAMNQVEDTTIVTMPSATPAQETPVTESRPPIRLSQMPTPLPPSPLQLLNAPKQGTPNIPETVEEEMVEKPVPSDTSLKENEPALKPGPRRAKRTAPRTRSARPPGSQPSSNEELKAAISARKIATPVSRLQQKMAEYSPVSPMSQRPISPIPESEGQTQNQPTSLWRQEQLREEQQKGSSQLSSPPLSSPPGESAPSSAKIAPQQEAVVQVPASSKDIAKEPTEPAPNSRPVSAGVPPSPPQDSHDEESTIEISSGHYRRIEESLRSAVPIAIPLAAEDITTSHVSASHPENTVDISRILPDDTLSNAAQPKVNELPPPPTLPPQSTKEAPEDTPNQPEQIVDDGNESTDSEDLDLPPRKQPSKPAVLVPGTPAEAPNTQASIVAVPESFKRAIAAPITFNFETPSAPLPPPFVPATGGFTPINSERVMATDPAEPRSPVFTSGDRSGPFTSPSRCIEFTPFRSFTSPRPVGPPRTPRDSERTVGGDRSALEPTTIISPFAFSQFMKNGADKESQFEVSRIGGKDGDGLAAGKDLQSSYDLENVLGGVEEYLMSDVYDVEEEAKRMSASFQRDERQSERRRRL
ncbi:hypothetical protein TWF696_005798 [Orbilia brochopaga]|uniref:Uncharacterized protein n=1 Tax=Orbilia brochopaga TaxID=3140254 RepID=A0AAV9UXC1_9PEZI